MNLYFKTLAGCCACIALLYGANGCKQAPQKQFAIASQQTLDSIPSGSGILIENGIAYIVSDDTTHIYQVDLASFDERRIPIRGLDSTIYREAKSIKHDFESAALISRDGQNYLLAIGSGSKVSLR